MIFYAIFLILLITWLYRRWQDRHSILLAKHFAYNKLQLIIGFGRLLGAKDLLKVFNSIAENYGKNALWYVGPYTFVVTTDPVVVKDILSSKLSIDKTDLGYDGLSNTIGRGLITISNDHWTRDRKIMNTAFKIGGLMEFMRTFNRKANDLLKEIDMDIEQGNETYLIHLLQELSINVSLETVSGRRFDYTEIDLKDYGRRCALGAEYVCEMSSNFIYLNPFLRYIGKKTIYKEGSDMMEFLREVLIESLINYKTLRGKDPSYLDETTTVMDYVDKAVQENKLQFNNAVDELMHIYIGSFESTATTVFNTMLMLGMHPDIQQRVYEEISQIYPDAEDDDVFDVAYEDLSKMVYLDLILKETLRLFPSVPLMGRMVRGGNLELSNGAVLPEGQRIMIDLYNLHRSKEVWGPDAERFNPDNFLAINMEQRHPFAYIPFAKGLRSCIGYRYADMNIKTTLAKCIKRYKFSSTAKMSDLVCANHIVLKLVDRPPLTVERRKTAKASNKNIN
ncbi:putative cytochrome P450 313a4 [Haematobia irritans]|uniref:putative cytochrome P450 313a4 n=1 Tax=Haematobia irritans TaxID=7368 RepID=UPI003F4FEC99